ncbi:hypothetical protein HYS54_01420 [Candidatus Micrarchaeota archaeon]|nr:hypothetical protein [Candidatus Micrarchaeota archaeon]
MRETLPGNSKQLDRELESLVFDVKYDKQQFGDSATIGVMLYRLARERQLANETNKRLLEKLESIEALLRATQSTHQRAEEPLISTVDAELLAFVREQKRVDAEEAQGHFGYKGKNAASARLNALYRTGLLSKGRAGKKVLYWALDPRAPSPPSEQQ